MLSAACDEQLATVARKEGELTRLKSRSEALHLFLKELVKRTGTYQGLAASLNTVLNSDMPGCKAATALGKRLLKDAQDANEVRSDIKFEDLVSFVSAVFLSSQRGIRDAARVNRMLEVIMNGLKQDQR